MTDINFGSHHWETTDTKGLITYRTCQQCNAMIASGPMGIVQVSGEEVCPETREPASQGDDQ